MPETLQLSLLNGDMERTPVPTLQCLLTSTCGMMKSQVSGKFWPASLGDEVSKVSQSQVVPLTARPQD